MAALRHVGRAVARDAGARRARRPPAKPAPISKLVAECMVCRRRRGAVQSTEGMALRSPRVRPARRDDLVLQESPISECKRAGRRADEARRRRDFTRLWMVGSFDTTANDACSLRKGSFDAGRLLGEEVRSVLADVEAILEAAAELSVDDNCRLVAEAHAWLDLGRVAAHDVGPLVSVA